MKSPTATETLWFGASLFSDAIRLPASMVIVALLIVLRYTEKGVQNIVLVSAGPRDYFYKKQNFCHMPATAYWYHRC
jgi:hypothetical protein